MKFVILILVISFLSADYGGGYAGSGFRYGSNAREFSMAGALVADKTPGFYTFSNPALLQYARSNQLGLSYQSMSLDRSIWSLNFVKDLPPTAGMGLAVLVAGTDNIEGRDSEGDLTEIFSSQEIQGIISFGVSLGTRMALGINLKIFFSDITTKEIDIKRSNGIGWDVGFVYKIYHKLLLGGVLDNLTSSYNWKYDDQKGDKKEYKELLPRTLKLGLTYTGFRGMSICFQEDIVSIPDKYINYRSRIGIEYQFSNGIKLRGGLKQTRGALQSNEGTNGFNFNPSFGAGIPLKIWKRQYVQLDYAIDPGKIEEGFSHLFSFSMKFK